MSKNILVIGATSLIAEHCLRIWAKERSNLYIVGRDNVKLDSISKDLVIRGAKKVNTYIVDFNDFDKYKKMFEQIEIKLKFIDIAFIAHGILPNQKKSETNLNLIIQQINTNATSSVLMLSHLANKFENQKSGTIAIISSVAGDRGRSSNYIYGSSKAMINTFTSGLRQRLYKSNVKVLTIKPGFVDTPMTAHLNKNFLWSKPQNIAKKIVKAIGSKNDEIYLSNFWSIVMFIIKIIPNFIYNKFKI